MMPEEQGKSCDCPPNSQQGHAGHQRNVCLDAVEASPHKDDITTQPCHPAPSPRQQFGGHVKQLQDRRGICTDDPPMAPDRPCTGQTQPNAKEECPPAKMIICPNEKVFPERPPCYLPQPEDEIPAAEKSTAESTECQKMGSIGPWATGHVDWSPLAGLTGTRPVVDRYSITRYSGGEWRKHNAQLLNAVGRENYMARVLDCNAHQCMEHVYSRGDKNQHDNTNRLKQRAHDIHRWKTELERNIEAMNEEIRLLDAQRTRLKTAMGVLKLPQSIVGECLDRRRDRIDPDLVRDEPEEELIKEMALMNEVRELMKRTLARIEQQMEHNLASKMRLELDWSDKKVAYEIETTNIGYNNSSYNIRLRPGAARFQDSQSTLEAWEFGSRESICLGEVERGKSRDLRHLLDLLLTDMSRDLRTQSDRVDSALATRIVEQDQCKQRLESDLLLTLQRIRDNETLINDLKIAIHGLVAGLKVAQSRLHNRLARPRIENCRDPPQYGLIEEVKSISESMAALKTQLRQAEDSWAELVRKRLDLETEIMVKRHSLHIDRDRCQEMRAQYPSVTALAGH